MFKNILTKNQVDILPLLKEFSREQLCYFQDIDYSGKVDFVGQPVPDEQVREFLTTAATSPFG